MKVRMLAVVVAIALTGCSSAMLPGPQIPAYTVHAVIPQVALQGVTHGPHCTICESGDKWAWLNLFCQIYILNKKKPYDCTLACKIIGRCG